MIHTRCLLAIGPIAANRALPDRFCTHCGRAARLFRVSDACYDRADRRPGSLTDALTCLLYASILLGVPVALALAWHGRPIAFAALLAAMVLIALVSAQGFEIFRGGAHGKAGMALVIVGPWALGISVATGVLGWILYTLGEAGREMRESDEDPPGP